MKQPGPIEIRAATPGDRAQMKRIQADGRLYASDGLHPVDVPGAPGDIKWTVARRGAVVVGFCAWGASQSAAEIRWFGVMDADVQGVATELIRSISTAVQHEARSLTVTYPAGQAESEFWDGMGFRPVTGGLAASEDVGLIEARARVPWTGRQRA